MKYSIFFFTGLIFITLASCTKLTGKGEIVVDSRHIPNFNAIILESEADIYITQGTLYLEVRGYENLVPDLVTEVKNDQLHISSKSNSIIDNNNLEVHLAIPQLVLIEVRGSGNVETESPLNVDHLIINLKGKSNIHLTGSAQHLDCNLQGTGDIHTCEMITVNGTAQLNGTGNIKMAPQYLNAIVDGTGNIYYLGNSQVSQQVNGVGSVAQINSCN
jgi:hypothetical protein